MTPVIAALLSVSQVVCADVPRWRQPGLLPEFEGKVFSMTNETEATCPLPTGLDRETEPVARIVYEGNRPFIDVNGMRLEPDINLCGGEHAWGLTYAAKCYDLGFRIFEIGVDKNEIEEAPGVYDFRAFDRQIRRLLTVAPDVRFILSFRVEFPKWCEEHPMELVGYADGEPGTGSRDERLGRPKRPSVASKVYKAEVSHFFDCLGAYVKARPWRNRVIGVRPCWGIYCEWHNYGMYGGGDVGPAMTAAFRRYCGGKYADETPPGLAERTANAFLLDPVRQRKVIDFYDCMATEVSDHLLFCAREAKRVLPGRLVGMYYGYVFAVHPPESATAQLAKVLASPDVDFLSDPSMYSAESRRAGGAFYQRTVPNAFHRVGKLVTLEDDMRFHHNAAYTSDKYICTRTPRESQVTMRRDYLNRLFDGCGIQMNDCNASPGRRPSAFDDPSVLLGMHEAMTAIRRVGARPMESGNRTAIVVSPEERYRRDGMHKASGRIWRVYGAPEYLYRTGYVFDILTLDDYLASTVDYRQVVLLNAFGPSDRQRQGLKRRLRRPGVSALWLIAPGSVTENGFSDAAMSDLCGMKLTGASADPHVSFSETDVRPFPCGGARKTLADGSVSAFVPDPPRDVAAWQDVLAALGARPLTEEQAYVRRHGKTIMFHTAVAGTHKVVLPDDLRGGKTEELLTGWKFEGDELVFETDGCDTLLFKTE